MPIKPLSVAEYFEGPESPYPMELVHGIVREPPAPLYGHQSVVTRATVLLDLHVRTHHLGRVCVSPIDVVLDEAAALVVQPDLIFVSEGRARIIRDRIWGAPDLVVEVLSRRTAVHDATEKLSWYLQYGVEECWLIDPTRRTVAIVDCRHASAGAPILCAERTAITSRVLPSFRPRTEEFFE